MAARRSLLYLARDFPVPVSGAARLRTYNWIVHFTRHFDVTFVAATARPVDAVYLDALRPYCTAVHAVPLHPQSWWRRVLARVRAEARIVTHGVPPEAAYLQSGPAAQVLAGLARQRQFDVVFCERWTWGPQAVSAGAFSVLDAGAVQAPRADDFLRRSRSPLRRILRPWIMPALARRETEMLASFGLVMTLSPADECAAATLCGDERTVSLPAGLDIQYFKPRRSLIDPSEIVFFSALQSPAQRDALLHLHRDIMPVVREQLGEARLTVVDAAPTAEFEDALRGDPFLGFTGPLEDPRPELWHAAVAALPLRFGAGSAAHLAQLLALGIPVIVTPHAARGLGVRSGEGVLIADDGPEFARLLAQVLGDSSLRDDLSRRGRATAESRFSLAATYDRWSALLAAGPVAH